MDRASKKDLESVSRPTLNGQDDAARRRKSTIDAATTPASEAPVQNAFAGAELTSAGRAEDDSETAEALKRAAGNDRRV
jgi:hypothetical protein